jgi:uncharacterized protein (TIGR03083 family)
MMTPLPPRDAAPLFRPLLDELLALLRALAPADWERPTVAGAWRVRDVAAHLLDGDLRKLSVHRDGHALPMDAPIASDRDLARFVNGLNAGGVAYGARLSPRVLVELLARTGASVAELVESLDPQASALFAVSWAGERTSANWMDTGREYTERWHHQMQIRDAVGAPRLLAPRWMEPLLDFSVRALPPAYHAVTAPDGSTVTLAVHGETSAAWSVVREASAWHVRRGRPDIPDAVVHVAADDAWRLLYNALPPDAVRQRVRVEGSAALAAPLLHARSVIV